MRLFFLTPEEREQILGDFNNTKKLYPEDYSFIDLFEEMVEEHSEQIAVSYREEELTYAELDKKANQLARMLRTKGVEADTIVGLMAERSLELVIGIVAILKAGGAYLPINPVYPDKRVHYMLTDSSTYLLLTQNRFLDRVKDVIDVIDFEEQQVYQGESTRLSKIITPKNLAYVIYTSGSTGHPKGVMIDHSSLTNFIYSTYDSYDGKFSLEDNGLSFANISFDASVIEFFLPLSFGGRLVLFPDEKMFNVIELAKIIVELSITFAYISPTLLKELYSYLLKAESVKLNKLFVGAEPIKNSTLQEFMSLNPSMKILNAYGPTEATVCATTLRYNPLSEKNQNVSIGKPVSNCKIYILDQANNLQAIGVSGEICISGAGVGRGYINQPELTAKKFVKDPFNPEQHMYRTGDLAKWLPDGKILFIGRIDQQVKIRGFRIEPGEIENKLLQHPGVKETVVTVYTDQVGDKYLCGYFTADEKINASQLRKHLSSELPDYMVPAFFKQIERIPVTANGKVHKKALPAPDLTNTGVEYVAPSTELEEILTGIWQEVLNKEKVGIHDNFFELGGHSLKATTLTSKIHKELNVEIPLSELFLNPTIKGNANYLEQAKSSRYAAVTPVDKREFYPLSSAQKRMFILNQFEKRKYWLQCSFDYGLRWSTRPG